MAERRMFAKTIIDSDAFLDMPLSTQALYFHLSMRADDDGFINNPKKIQRMIGALDDDLKLLIAKNYIIPFESGIVVIKHWRIHNYIQKDRYKPTVYAEEKEFLKLKENNAYTLDTECIHDGYSLETQVRLGKDRLDKNNISVDYEAEFERLWERYPRKQGKKDALRHYTTARKNGVDFETISQGLDNYLEHIRICKTEQRYIKQGSTWFCQRSWDDEYVNEIQKGNKFNNFNQRGYSDTDYEAIERMMS